MRFVVIRKKWIVIAAVLFAVIGSGSWFYLNQDAAEVINHHADEKAEIHMVTGEFTSQTDDGRKIEAYRFDPGSITIQKGEAVTLTIHGVNGAEHPFRIEGTDIKGVVKKGEKAVIPLKFDEEGTYRLICDTHSRHGQGAPMIAYIVVD
ncbi:cupredoxin domain-containing protein [Metabacillus indicus]|uniref:EfeO-type cupredoxin-like domain-containing protein n=1 Tax=Metabacillus indicus TaxID=246786 RepID=A0A084H485_METID|nr:cupredoxin domain-containing protein [Metabacillus indicus]KEZ54397.1 hypothetical protein GS18_0205630 [Metabacillus indicus]